MTATLATPATKLPQKGKRKGNAPDDHCEALPGLVLSCGPRRRERRELCLWDGGGFRPLPRGNQHTGEERQHRQRVSAGFSCVFLFLERVAETRCFCCRGGPPALFPCVGGVGGTTTHEQAPRAHDRWRGNQRPRQQPQRPATGFRSPPQQRGQGRRWESVVGVPRNRWPRPSHAHGEIVARQCVADEKRPEKTERCRLRRFLKLGW